MISFDFPSLMRKSIQQNNQFHLVTKVLSTYREKWLHTIWLADFSLLYILGYYPFIVWATTLEPLQILLLLYKSMVSQNYWEFSFLSAFLDRLSKAKLSIESIGLIDPSGKDIIEIRKLSTAIIQQWNFLFPNSLIQSNDTVSTNSLIATKTR